VPKITLYVKDSDNPIWESARELAQVTGDGSLSSLVTYALKNYVDRERLAASSGNTELRDHVHAIISELTANAGERMERMLLDREKVDRTRKLRWEFLHALYRSNDQVRLGHLQCVPAFEIARIAGIEDKAEAERVFFYLKNAGLLEFLTFGPNIAITKAGIDAVEEAIAAPDRPTEHFGPIHLLYVAGNISGSQVQQGSHHSSQAMTTTTQTREALSEILPEIRAMLGTLRPNDQRSLSDLATVEAELQSPAPRSGIVREFLHSLRAVLEEAGGGLLAARLGALMQQANWF
jgi:hypothetical protein